MTSSTDHPLDHDLTDGHTDFDAAIAATGVPLKVFTDPADGSRVAVFAPSGVRVSTLDQARALSGLQRTHSALVKLRLALDENVAAAREEGLSWASIGFSVGMTSEGARTRWAD